MDEEGGKEIKPNPLPLSKCSGRREQSHIRWDEERMTGDILETVQRELWRVSSPCSAALGEAKGVFEIVAMDSMNPSNCSESREYCDAARHML
jgi:hypothetical protein